MIAERLDQRKIVFGLEGDFDQALDRLCSYSSLPDLAAKLHEAKPQHKPERYSYIGQGVAVPHVRIDNLPGPELILGLSPEGLKLNNERVHVLLLLATPTEQPAQHLQLLQRISSLLPAIRDELLDQHDPRRVLKVVARAEQISALPT
jgi:mannitol/fructose-specific phosphotransferase system IIA component (Ntr-type)